MKKFILFILLLIIMGVGVASSQTVQTLGTFKQGSDVILYQVCNNCSFNNISYVSYPNLTTIYTNLAMVKSGVTYTYSLSGNFTFTLGRYLVCGFGDNDGTLSTWCYDFFINGTGRAEPSGSVLTFFIIMFLFVLLTLVYLFVYSVGHVIKQDFDMIDLAFDYGIYFVLLGLYFMQIEYLGNVVMNSILSMLIYVGAFTHIFASTVFFIISIFHASLEKKKFVQSGGVGWGR